MLYSAVLLYDRTHMVSDGVILALLLLQLQHHRMISYLIQSTCHANLLLTSFQLECTLQALVVLYYSLRAVALRTEGYLHLVLLRAYCCCCCELRAAGLLVRPARSNQSARATYVDYLYCGTPAPLFLVIQVPGNIAFFSSETAYDTNGHIK